MYYRKLVVSKVIDSEYYLLYLRVEGLRIAPTGGSPHRYGNCRPLREEECHQTIYKAASERASRYKMSRNRDIER